MSSTGRRSGRGADDGEVERGIRPAARIAGHLAAERRRRSPRAGHAPGSASGPSAAAACPLGRGRQAAAAPSAARCRARTSAGPARAAVLNSSAVEISERAADLDHPLRRDPEKAAEPDELGPHFALELVELRDRPGLDELAQASPRCPGRSRCSSWTRPARDELGDRSLRRADRLGRAAVRTGRVEARRPRGRAARRRLRAARRWSRCPEESAWLVSLAAWRRSSFLIA